MSTLTAPIDLSAPVLDAATALAGALPLGPWTPEPTSAPEVPSDARAISAPLTGVGRAVFVVPAELVAELTVDGELTDVLGSAIAQALAIVTGSDPEDAALREIDAATALDARTGDTVFAATLTGSAGTAVFAVIADAPAAMSSHVLHNLADGAIGGGAAHPVSMLGNVEMGVSVELGRARMLVKEILGLTIGSVVELDRAAGSPVDVLVNGTLIARGEVVVVDEEFGVRISEVIGHNADAYGRR